MFPTTKHKGFISEFTGNGTHCPAAVQYFEANLPNGVDANGVTQYKIFEIATHVGFYSYTNDLSAGSEMVLDPGNLAISSANATLNNVSVWSANSILTQGRADGRYATPACLTYANISGTPTLANVATSGNYTDLINTPNLSVYLTTASAASTYQTISGMSVYLTVATAASTYYPASNPNGYITSSALFPYQLAATNTWANLTGKPTLATVATSGNYNDLSNTPAAYSLPTASNTVLGGVKIGGNISIANGTISVALPASYTLPAATNTTLGGVIVGANLSIANGTLSANIPATGVTAAKSIAFSMIFGR